MKDNHKEHGELREFLATEFTEECGSLCELRVPGSTSDSVSSVVKYTMVNPHLNDIATKTIGCALTVHKALGPGLLESAYQACLYYELNKAGIWVEKEKPLPLVYQEVTLECGYRIDLIVERKLIVEVKSVEALNDIHLAQVLTYLKLSHCKLGLLINFNVVLLKDGIKRVILG